METYTSSKDGKPYTEEQIIKHLRARMDQGADDDTCTGLLWQRFGFGEEMQERLLLAAKRLPKSAWTTPAAPITQPKQIDISDIAQTINSDAFSSVNDNDTYFTKTIIQTSFDLLNNNLANKRVKKLTYRDLAIIYAAFKNNVESNEDGGCPQQSIIAFTQQLPEVASPYSTLHIKVAIDIFIKLGMAVVETPHNHFKHKGTCYKMISQT